MAMPAAAQALALDRGPQPLHGEHPLRLGEGLPDRVELEGGRTLAELVRCDEPPQHERAREGVAGLRLQRELLLQGRALRLRREQQA